MKYIFIIVCVFACSKEKEPDTVIPVAHNFPTEVAHIFTTKCATTGCHNEASKAAAAGLSLASWDSLFRGSKNNAAVIPYRPDYSFLMFFVNTYPEFGPIIQPTMPYNAAPLTKTEVTAIRDWINAGSKSESGKIAFHDFPNRSKIYVVNQGCDNVTVLDRQTRIAFKYIDVGISPGIESPHVVKMSPDQQFWFVCFYAGGIFQKFSSVSDSLVGTAQIGDGSWNTFALSKDGKYAYVVDLNVDGKIAVVDLENMKLLITYQGNGLLEWPHGSALSNDTILYITAQYSNFIYKINVKNPLEPEFEKIPLGTGETPVASSKYDPHCIHVAHDNSIYAVSCQKSNEVRIMKQSNDSLLAILPTGPFTQEVEFSHHSDYVFITCMEDNTSFPGKTGSVYIYNFRTFQHIKTLYTGHQPHGIYPDDEKGIVYVANRNVSTDGPAPHHSTDCGGRNGYLTFIDMKTFELVPNAKLELSVDPYYIAVKE